MEKARSVRWHKLDTPTVTGDEGGLGNRKRNGRTQTHATNTLNQPTVTLPSNARTHTQARVGDLARVGGLSACPAGAARGSAA